MQIPSFVCLIGLFSCLLSTVSSLSCYVCDKEGWNWGSCTGTFTKCLPFQDSCTSYVSFSLPLHYAPRSERYHSISKGCDTQLGCQTRQNALDQSTCQRSSYSDWSCVECCTGDLCNYYITLGAGSAHISFAMIVLAVLVHWFFLL